MAIREIDLKKQPTSIEEYRAWLEKLCGKEIGSRMRNHYESVALKVKHDFEASDFWANVAGELSEFDAKYQLETGFPLLVSIDPPKILTKSYESFLLKTYRRNVIDNEDWPDPPSGGWLQPPDWFSRINDIVRTCFAVKYLDGVEFLLEKMQQEAEKLGVQTKQYFVAGDDGYYAAHFYAEWDFEIPLMTYDTRLQTMHIELQITSQLQEVIRRMLHRHFEARRGQLKKSEVDWQWDYRSEALVHESQA